MFRQFLASALGLLCIFELAAGQNSQTQSTQQPQPQEPLEQKKPGETLRDVLEKVLRGKMPRQPNP